MRKKLCSWFLLLLLMAVNPAVAQEAKPDVVDAMKAAYYDKYEQLPPSRKCTPQDARGAWVEDAIFEVGATTDTAEQETEGKKYLYFADYNLLVWQRSQAPLSEGVLAERQKDTPLQYIMTVAGMMYVYEGGTATSSSLCFVATEDKEPFKKGALMLAKPLDDELSYQITLYAPLGGVR